MAHEEKRAWIMLVVSSIAYLVYVAIILGRAAGGELAAVPYVAALLWTVGAAIAISIALTIAIGVPTPHGDKLRDQRDLEIARLSDNVGGSFVAIGGIAALLMSLAEINHFWIANVIFLGFALSAVLGSITKIMAYRKGFQEW